jgi:hypothetical protein
MNRQLCLPVFITVIASLAMAFPGQLDAASTSEARVTRVKNQVQLADSNNIARSASVNDIVREQTIVRTGNRSRGEVTFSNQTVVRIAAHTAFDFSHGTRGLFRLQKRQMGRQFTQAASRQPSRAPPS